MNTKELKQLVAACRKLGIKTYKNQEFEFTLTDDAPVSNYKKRTKKQQKPLNTGDLEANPELNADDLTDEQLLMWSVAEVEGNS